MDNFIERPRFSCALSGALAAAAALPETIPIVHSVAGCVGNAAWTQQGGSALQVGGPCGCLSVPGTNLREREVVFGGADRLREQIAHTLEVMEGRFYVVLTGCVAEVIGDDVDSVVREFQRSGTAIIAAQTGGFRGDSYRGYEELLKALFRDYVKGVRKKTPRLVNVWGVVPGLDVFWRGNLEAVRRLLEELGLVVNTFFTGHDSLETLERAGNAELNVVVSPQYGVEAAKTFAELHGTEYLITPFPLGPEATGRFLKSVAAAINIREQEANRIIERGYEHFYRYLSPLTDPWVDFDFQRYALVIGDANYAFAVADFLAETIGWLPEQVVVTDPLRKDQREELLRRRAAARSVPEHRLVFETDTSAIRNHLDPRWFPLGDDPFRESFSPAFVIGSSMDRELAETLRAAHLSVSFPVANRAILDRTYVGFTGGLRLVEDLVGTLVAGR